MKTLFNTLNEALLHHADPARDRNALYMLDNQNDEEVLSYSQIRDRSLVFARYLLENGLEKGDRVVIILPTCTAFVYLYFGTLLAGGTPVPTYPPSSLGNNALFIRNLRHIFENSQARFFGASHRILESFRSVFEGLPALEHTFDAEQIDTSGTSDSGAGVLAVEQEDIALIQYTSGSTGFPKGVVLTHRNLVNNMQGINDALQVDPKTDFGLSWLPLFHDMGLIGCLLNAIYTGGPLALMPTEVFIRRPERWLQNISHYKATISPSPNFGYHLCTRLVRPSRLKELDLSSWRAALSGAEAVDVAVLDSFAERFRPFGFNKQAFLPAYGLAESSLAVALHPTNSELTVARLNRNKLECEELAEHYGQDGANLSLVPSVGRCIPGQEVSIRSSDGTPLPDNRVGEIWVRGPSVTNGYYNDKEATAASFQDGWLKTGDLGFQYNGDLFITGRIKELIIKRGRNYFPTDIERCLWQIKGIREGRCVALATRNSESSNDDLLLIVEIDKKMEDLPFDELARTISSTILEAIGIRPNRTVFIPPKSIPKTSSGKIQRLLCRKLLAKGDLEVLADIRPKKRQR